MKPSSEPSIQAYVKLVRSAEALHAGVSRGLLPEGLSASQFSAMKALRIHGKLAQRDIAKSILKSGGNITILVDRLEEMELVSRERDVVDRRITYVSLTKKGQDLFDEIYPGHLDRIREAMGGLSADECNALVRLLERLSAEEAEFDCSPSASVAA